MYAVIESGGKQFRVELGTELEVDRLDGDPGSTVELGRVLLVADGDDATIGRPVVDGARVSASVVRQGRGEKITVFKYRPKTRRRVKHGHRQETTLLRVSDIVFRDRSAAKQAEAERTEEQRARAEAEQAAARQAADDEALARRLAKQAEAKAATTTPKTRTTRARSGDRAEASGKRAKAETAGDATPSTRRSRAGEPAERSPARRTAAGTSKTETTATGRATARRTQAPEPDDKPKRGNRKGS